MGSRRLCLKLCVLYQTPGDSGTHDMLLATLVMLGSNHSAVS